MRRQEDPPFLRGQAQFVADLAMAQALEAVIVRSVHAYARILSMETREAAAMPGVTAVLAAADLPASLSPIPVRLSSAPELLAALQYPLAKEYVRYVGEPVAVVVASSRYLAEDAANRVRISYQPLDPASSIDKALAHAPLFEGLQTNRVYVREHQKGSGRAGVAGAPCRLTLSFRIQRHTAMPLETRGLVAVPEKGRLSVYGVTKVPHFNRRILADLLEIPLERLRFVEVAVGGGFGVRGEFYPEDYLIPYLAQRLNRPVCWIEDRLEHFQATNHSREQRHEVEVGFDETGRVWGLTDDIWVDTGAYIRTHGVTVPELTQAMLPGPYDWPALKTRLHVVLTNKTPTGTYRGPGRFEGTFVRERVMDAVARALGMDPTEVRMKNLLTPDRLPYTNGLTALGEEVVMDSGDYPRALLRAKELMQASTIQERKALSRQNGRLRGLGFAVFVEKSGLGPWEDVRLVLGEDGMVTCFTGLSALGQGTATMLSLLVSESLGIPAENIRVVYGDSDQVPFGYGTFASRGTVVGGTAAHLAAVELRRRVAQVAAKLLEANPDDVVMTPQGVSVAGVPAHSVSYRQLCQGARADRISLDVMKRFQSSAMTYPYGVHGCEIEIAPQTGQLSVIRYGVVYDVGKAVSLDLVADQIVGGVAQGFGGGLWEEIVYDENGQLQTGTFLDYLMPGPCEVPDVEVVVLENSPSPSNPLGLKGAGEGGAVGVAPALANAIADATGAPGEAFTALPIRPQDILRWIRAGGSRI